MEMKLLIASGVLLLLGQSALGEGSPEPLKLQVSRAGSRATNPGPADYFTGDVRVEPLFGAQQPGRATGAYVTFPAGARTAWHTHPIGQVLVVTAGVGRVQQWGQPIEEIRAGDVVQIPAGTKHWHGAAPASAMTHLAITEQLDGKAVDWLEKVTDGQYGATASLTHLAFYAGWPSAVTAAGVAKEVFAEPRQAGGK